MSLFGALNVAMSSITAINTTTRVLSDNIANSDNENYNARDANLKTLEFGGVQIADITRKVNNGLFQDLINATAETATNKIYNDIYLRIDQLLGTANNTTPLVNYVKALETSWKAFEAAPESDAAEKGVIQAGHNLLNELERLSDGLDQIYNDMKTDMEYSIKTLNDSLSEVNRLNDNIIHNKVRNMPTGNLENLRDEQIKIVAELMKIKQIRNDDGSVFLYTSTGLDLVSANASTFTWDPATLALTKSGNSSTNLITDGTLTEGKIDSLTRMLRTDNAATRNPDGSFAPIQKLRNQLDEFSFILIDDTVARATGNLFVKATDLLTGPSIGMTAGDQFTISGGGVSPTTITIGAGDTVATIMASINAITNVSARIDAHGNLQILTSAEGLTIADATGTPLGDLGFTAGTYAADLPPTLNYAYNEEYTKGEADLSAVADLTTLGGIAAGDSFDISVAGGATTTVTINAGDSITDLLATLNGIAGIRAKLDANGHLRISTVEGQLNIANNVNTPLSPTGLGIASTSGHVFVNNKARSDEESLDFFEVETGAALTDASRINIRVNDKLSNGTKNLKDSAGNGVVEALAGTNRNLSGSGLTAEAKDYTGLMSSAVGSITQYSGQFAQLYKQEDTIRNGLVLRLRNNVGVDIDEEMALLSVIQNSYTATARVINAINNMFDSLSQAIR